MKNGKATRPHITPMDMELEDIRLDWDTAMIIEVRERGIPPEWKRSG